MAMCPHCEEQIGVVKREGLLVEGPEGNEGFVDVLVCAGCEKPLDFRDVQS